MKVFLGGTCNGSEWRNELMPLLDKFGINYFNPVVEDWTPDCQEEERIQKNQLCNVHLYVITPRMKGVFSIAEIIESAHMSNKKTVVMFIDKDGDAEFDKAQMKSLQAVGDMAARHGAYVCPDFETIISHLIHIKDFENDLDQIHSRKHVGGLEKKF